MKSKISIILALAVVVALVAGLFGVIGAAPRESVAAEVLAVPTPVTNNAGPKISKSETFWAAHRLTADAGSTVIDVGNYALADIEWIIDVGTVNTTTFTLQFSNDGTHWVNGVAVASAVAADVTNLAQFYTFGRYARVYADVINSNPVTATVLAVLK